MSAFLAQLYQRNGKEVGVVATGANYAKLPEFWVMLSYPGGFKVQGSSQNRHIISIDTKAALFDISNPALAFANALGQGSLTHVLSLPGLANIVTERMVCWEVGFGRAGSAPPLLCRTLRDVLPLFRQIKPNQTSIEQSLPLVPWGRAGQA